VSTVVRDESLIGFIAITYYINWFFYWWKLWFQLNVQFSVPQVMFHGPQISVCILLIKQYISTIVKITILQLVTFSCFPFTYWCDSPYYEEEVIILEAIACNSQKCYTSQIVWRQLTTYIISYALKNKFELQVFAVADYDNFSISIWQKGFNLLYCR
jgi:hypothetical protein